MNSHSKRFVKLAEALTPILLDIQDMDMTSINYGDIIIQEKGYSEPGAMLVPILHFVGMYYHPSSSYYMNETLLERISLLLDILLKNMHEDGTMDLKETNFHDSTVVAFIVTPLAYAYRVIISRGKNSDIEQVIINKMFQFFKKGAEGMRNGGFHTPNHRWVMAAALSIVSNILDNPIYKDEAMKFINEGIDCDEEGEYIERSVAIYDVTVNESLITIAQELDMPEIIDYVARNVKKNYAYLEPDETMCTLNSRRQDKQMKYLPLRHYWATLYLAHHYDDEFYAALSEHLLKLMEKRAHALPSYLFTGGKEDVHTPILHFLLDPKLSKKMKGPDTQWEGDGHWYFPKNGVVRQIKDKTSLTLLRDKELFLKYQNGENTAIVKIASCFFGMGYFVPTKLEKTRDGYRMSSSQKQGYYKPLNKEINPLEWENLKKVREKINVQEHNVTVDVILSGDDVKLNIKIDGVIDVPLKIEVMLSSGGRFETNDIMINGKQGSYLILKEGSATYTLDRDVIRIGNGIFAHWNTSNMRGTVPASNDHFTVYMTGFTPFEHSITISNK
ncbi:MAG: hypothetical protein KAQ68_00685 [Clostridiales bacterium]|nr:hypothetical protein [Clostridiales bacterium]